MNKDKGANKPPKKQEPKKLKKKPETKHKAVLESNTNAGTKLGGGKVLLLQQLKRNLSSYN
jgi:hypothetical protein